MWVKCDASECVHNRDNECQMKWVTLEDGQCTEYKDYSENNPAYQSVYFKRCRTMIDRKIIEYRTQSRGMRYEWKGFVLYTEDDIRYSIDNARFTEEITGLLMSGAHMRTLEGYEEIVRKHVDELPPVLELPWFETDKKTHELVPHKQSLDEILAPNGVSGDLAP